MIVVAEPRSGATKFCMDLAEQSGQRFIGEPTGENLVGFISGSTYKEQYHETSYQPRLTLDEIFDTDNIILANKYVVPYLQQSSYLILRRSCIDGILSCCNKVMHSHGSCDTHMLNIFMETRYSIVTYALEYNKDILWYEDFDFARPVNTSNLDSNDISFAYSFRDNFYFNSDLDKKQNQLLTFTQ